MNRARIVGMDIDRHRTADDFDSANTRFDSWRPSQSLQGVISSTALSFRLSEGTAIPTLASSRPRSLDELTPRAGSRDSLNLSSLHIDARCRRCLVRREGHDLRLG